LEVQQYERAQGQAVLVLMEHLAPGLIGCHLHCRWLLQA
jgi:hypothetical protein